MNMHIAQALFEQGLDHEAIDYIRDYWGGMPDRGATTLWEIEECDRMTLEVPKDTQARVVLRGKADDLIAVTGDQPATPQATKDGHWHISLRPGTYRIEIFRAKPRDR